jgi:hypothetical protein
MASALSAALLTTATRALTRRAAPAGAPAIPSEAEVDSLARYLRPGPATPRLDDYSVFLPARTVPHSPARGVPSPHVELERLEGPRLGGIVVAGSGPVAILDGESAAVGDRIRGGWTVVTIAPDRVVLRAPGGALRTLSLSTR